MQDWCPKTAMRFELVQDSACRPPTVDRNDPPAGRSARAKDIAKNAQLILLMESELRTAV
jgi:hypothetical protein